MSDEERDATSRGEGRPTFDDPSGSHVTVERPTWDDSRAFDAAAHEGSIWKARIDLLRELPHLEHRLDETYLYILPRDPAGLFLLWEVSQGTRDHLSATFGPGFLENNFLVARVYDVTGVDFDGYNAVSVFEVDDFLVDKSHYFVRVTPGRNYVAEIGFRSKGTTYFEKIARSNTVFAPLGEDQREERYAERGSVPCPSADVELPAGPDGWTINKYLLWKQGRHPDPPERGRWALVLHHHLPFVRHPEYDVSLEEQWYFEAVVGVYTQLLAMMTRLLRDRVDFRITVSLTPPLLSMMEDPLLRGRTARHVVELIRLATRERNRAKDPLQVATLNQALRRIWSAKEMLDAYGGDLAAGYRHFQDIGKLEVITSAATHFLLPLHRHTPATVRAQLQTAVRQYRRLFGRAPRGIWLPENAFTPGLDDALAAEGIRWTLVTARSLREGDTRCWYGSGAPVVSPAGVAFYGIDEATRHRIWSRQDGYPGHATYKEWYRDLGYDLPWDQLPEYWKTAGVRRNTGLKVHAIGPRGTSLGDKPSYDPDAAERTLQAQAAQFVFERGAQANAFRDQNGGVAPCIVSAYDAELFGHWWEEGPDFLESVYRRLMNEQGDIRPVTPGEDLAAGPSMQRMMPGAGSWGRDDFFQTWIDEKDGRTNGWIWRHLFRLSERMATLAARFVGTSDPLRIRALNQAARCLFLAGASDWGFLISTGQAARYSEVQIITHLDRARELMKQAESGEVKLHYLEPIELADCIFPFADMDFRVFCGGHAGR